jgi:hypothetical protein
MKITDYYIVAEPNVAQLTVRVSKRIKLGWQPHGSVYEYMGEICQVVVKVEEKSFAIVR